MKKSSTSGVFWWLSVIIGIIGILMHEGVININIQSFWVLVAAWGLLVIGSRLK